MIHKPPGPNEDLAEPPALQTARFNVIPPINCICYVIFVFPLLNLVTPPVYLGIT